MSREKMTKTQLLAELSKADKREQRLRAERSTERQRADDLQTRLDGFSAFDGLDKSTLTYHAELARTATTDPDAAARSMRDLADQLSPTTPFMEEPPMSEIPAAPATQPAEHLEPPPAIQPPTGGDPAAAQKPRPSAVVTDIPSDTSAFLEALSPDDRSAVQDLLQRAREEREAQRDAAAYQRGREDLLREQQEEALAAQAGALAQWGLDESSPQRKAARDGALALMNVSGVDPMRAIAVMAEEKGLSDVSERVAEYRSKRGEPEQAAAKVSEQASETADEPETPGNVRPLKGPAVAVAGSGYVSPAQSAAVAREGKEKVPELGRGLGQYALERLEAAEREAQTVGA